MAALIFLLTGWFAPLPPHARPPGTIGMVCAVNLGEVECAGPSNIHDVDVGLWVMEKTESSFRRDFNYIITCSEGERGCKVEKVK